MTSSRVADVFHRLDGVAHQIEQDLLNLHLVGEHEIQPRRKREAHPHAPVLGADQRQRACLLDQLFYVLDAPLALAVGDEIAQPADDLAGAQRLIGRLVHGVANKACAFVGAIFQEPARSLHVIGDGRQRLVEFVGKGRGHLAHRGQPRHVNELGL